MFGKTTPHNARDRDFYQLQEKKKREKVEWTREALLKRKQRQLIVTEAQLQAPER